MLEAVALAIAQAYVAGAGAPPNIQTVMLANLVVNVVSLPNGAQDIATALIPDWNNEGRAVFLHSFCDQGFEKFAIRWSGFLQQHCLGAEIFAIRFCPTLLVSKILKLHDSVGLSRLQPYPNYNLVDLTYPLHHYHVMKGRLLSVFQPHKFNKLKVRENFGPVLPQPMSEHLEQEQMASVGRSTFCKPSLLHLG